MNAVSHSKSLDEKTSKNFKTFFLVIVGNILDYYDFLLFAHLGFIITPLFITDLAPVQSHLLSLFLFGIPFVVRPLGGYIFGRFSDLKGRKYALAEAIKWSAFATLGFAFLPTYETGGLICAYLFVFFRLMQGVSLGGEYPTAGTYLMEHFPKKRGFISSILVASGTVGSLVALGFAWLCLKESAPSWLWRVAFFLGGAASLVSYYMRKHLSLDVHSQTKSSAKNSFSLSIIIILFIGLLIGLTVWLPFTFTNFYLTKIKNYSAPEGLFATFVALTTYVIANPIFGYISDYFSKRRYLILTAFLVIPLSFLGFWFLTKDFIVLGQILFTLGAVGFGAPLHKVINAFFPYEVRSRYVNLFLMLGLGLGGLGPILSGYVVNATGWVFFPCVLLSFAALTTGIVFVVIKRFPQDKI
jgi:MFS transporter, MHS family, proline/betaine transporter